MENPERTLSELVYSLSGPRDTKVLIIERFRNLEAQLAASKHREQLAYNQGRADHHHEHEHLMPGYGEMGR